MEQRLSRTALGPSQWFLTPPSGDEDFERQKWQTLYRMWTIPPSLIPSDGMVLTRNAPKQGLLILIVLSFSFFNI